MKPIDFRDATFADLQPLLMGMRREVYEAWQAHGPGTTRAVAHLAGIDLLTFRPRTTELYQMGCLRLADGLQVSHEGIYQARTLAEWEQWIAAQRWTVGRQMQLV